LAIWAGAPSSASWHGNRTPQLIPHDLLLDDGDVILHHVLATGSRQRPGFGSHPVEELVFEGDHPRTRRSSGARPA
jgi:hypothetical protein